MKPYYEDKQVTIFHGNCLEVMPDLGPVDAVICDPPFEAEAHTLGRRIMSGEGLVEAPLPFGPMDAITRASVTFYTRKILNDGWFLAFCQIEAVPLWVKSIVDSGGKYKRSCIWVKPDATPQFSGDRPAQGFETFVCGWYGDGGSKWNGGGRRGIFTHNKAREIDYGHPTQKPDGLMAELVELFTNPGNLILDPFMGSGTTLRAAKDLGRRAIGIEVNEEYCEMAAKRMAQEVLNFT